MRSPKIVFGRAAAGAVAVLALAALSAPAAQALTPPHIYWTDQGSNTIGIANLDGTAVNKSFITGATTPELIAVDGKYIYWSNSGGTSIGRANLDGTGVNQTFITTINSPSGVAVNDKYVYWMNNNGSQIGRANLDGTGANQSFITGASCGVGVAVNSQYIYWANFCTDTIGRANLDGTGANQTFITGASFPGNVAVDGQHIYWDNGGYIGEANLDGTDVDQTFITTGNGPAGVAVDTQRVYWGNFNPSSSIGVANLDGTFVNNSFITGLGNPAGVALDVPIATASPASLPKFPKTRLQSLSAPKTITVSNSGTRPLVVSGFQFGGKDPGDFVMTSDSCLGAVAPDESCQVTVSFAPQGKGTRSAALEMFSSDFANSPTLVPLSGKAAAKASRVRRVGLLTCKLAHATGTCAGRLVSGSIESLAGAQPATVARAGIVYATGASVLVSSSRDQLVLTMHRGLAPGRYTLTRRVRDGGRWLLHKTEITIN